MKFFFTGSGISAADLCSFPLGQELHRILLQYYTDMTNLEIDDFLSQNLVSFEKTVDVILTEYGNIDHINAPFHLVSDIFIYRNEDSNWKQTNDYHKFFKYHILQGGKHFTVNLDQFIELDNNGIHTLTANDIEETCGNNLGSSGFLFKIHGDPNLDYVGLQGFLHRVIESGLSEQVQTFFDNQMHEVKTVIFIGYGGVDQFDITPYFESKPDCFFKNTTALWINYSCEKEISISTELTQAQQSILSKFSNWAYVRCSPVIILNQLFNHCFPPIVNVHRNNGYKRQYEDFFRINTVQEVVDINQNIDKNGLKDNMLRRRKIREELIKCISTNSHLNN